MKFLIIHNRYSRTGGEESVVAAQCELLRSRGHEVTLYQRSYDEMQEWPLGRIQSLFTSLRSPRSMREIRDIIDRERPQVAIVHNLFPIISAAILPMMRQRGVIVMMTLHNYRLACPTGLFFRRGEICERCASGALREWNCALGRCEGSLLGSVAYALRGWFSRRMGYFTRGVDVFMALSDFQRDKLSRCGIARERTAVIPNFIDIPEKPIAVKANLIEIINKEPFIAYVGRLSHEKGVDLLFETARLLPHVRFRVAGAAASDMAFGDIPQNIELVGYLDRERLAQFYTEARAVVLSSRCWEGFPLSVIEAMGHARAVVVPRWAAIPEIVEHGACGRLYTPCSAADMALAITELWSNPSAASELGARARVRAMRHYTADVYYQNIISAIERCKS